MSENQAKSPTARTVLTVTARPLLTVEDVHRWHANLDALEKQYAEIANEIQTLRKKLEAAELFMPEDAKVLVGPVTASGFASASRPTTPPSVSDAGATKQPTLTETIRNLLAEQNKPLKKLEIRRLVEADRVWKTKVEASPNYFYTLLRRLETRKVVKKTRGGSFSLVETPGTQP